MHFVAALEGVGWGPYHHPSKSVVISATLNSMLFEEITEGQKQVSRTRTCGSQITANLFATPTQPFTG